jgi:hypothetical protein
MVRAVEQVEHAQPCVPAKDLTTETTGTLRTGNIGSTAMLALVSSPSVSGFAWRRGDDRAACPWRLMAFS